MVRKYEFDPDLTWSYFKSPVNTTIPLIVNVSGTLNSYAIMIYIHFNRRELFPKIRVVTNQEEVIFEKKIKAGLQYNFQDDIAIYFNTLLFNPENLGIQDQIGTIIRGAYAVL